MKALVLCGGIPQIALIEELKSRGIYTILADMNPNVVARAYADSFYPVSVLDVTAVKELAIKESVDFIITACADQVLLVQAKVSEELGLPCYIDYKTAQDVSSKALMKKIFLQNDIPTSRYVVLDKFEGDKVKNLQYPLIVKPVDSYSSRGVKKVCNGVELEVALKTAINISRTNTAIVEEFVDGEELTVDVYIEDGETHVLCISNIDKIPNNDGFVICRTRYPAQITDETKKEIQKIANKIAFAFSLKNSPMLVQIIKNGDRLSVVEFCARTGGGDKFKLIKQVSQFDVIKAVVDLTLGKKPHVGVYQFTDFLVNEFLYVKPGIFDHLEGFSELKEQGIIQDYYQLKAKGSECGEIKSSGDRVAYYTIQGSSMAVIMENSQKANEKLKVISKNDVDILRHDLIETLR